MRNFLQVPFRRWTPARAEKTRYAVPPLSEARRAAEEGLAAPAASLPFAERLQRAFGRHRVEGIQAHVGPRAEAGALEMGAAAFATGEHVVLGARRDLRAVAHEAAHVVQQRAGISVPGGIGRPEDIHERQAEEVADRVVAGRSAEDVLDRAGSVRGVPAGARLERPAAEAPRPIQQLNLGWVPAKPKNWRGFTTKVGNGPATNGFSLFSKAKRLNVEANNIAQVMAAGGGLAPALPVGNYPASDNKGIGGGGALLSYAVAKTIAPETDHIVTRAEGGANDYENARLLSKAENTNPATPRPKTPWKGGVVADTHLRIYEPIKIQVMGAPTYGLAAGKAIAAGSKLTLNQVRALTRWAGGPKLANWAAFNKVQHQKIQAKPKGGGWVGAGFGQWFKVW